LAYLSKLKDTFSTYLITLVFIQIDSLDLLVSERLSRDDLAFLFVRAARAIITGILSAIG